MSQNNEPVKVDIRSTFDAKGTSEAKREIESLTTTVNKSGQASQEVAGHAGALRLGVMGVAGAAAAAGVAVAAYAAYQMKLAGAYIETAEQMAKLSERTGIGISELARMNAVALTNDTTVERLAMGLKNLAVKQLEANSGNAQAIAIFKALGVEYEDGAGKLRRTNDVMDDVATKFAAMESGAGKNAVAAKLLGRGLGEDLIPYLNKGADGLKRMRDDADKLGIKIDEDTARAVKDLKDNLKLLQLTAESAAGAFATPFVKALNEATAAMIRARKEGSGLFGSLWSGVRSLAADTDEDKLNQQLGIKNNALASIAVAQKGKAGTISPVERRRYDEIIARANAKIDEVMTAPEGIMALQKRISGAKPDLVPKIAPPDFLEKPEREGRARAAPVDRDAAAIAQLQSQLMRRDDATTQEMVQYDIEAGKYKDLKPETQQRLLDIAREIDLIKQRAEALKASGVAMQEEIDLVEMIAQMESQKLRQSVGMRESFAHESLMIDARLSNDRERIANTEFDLQKQAYQKQINAVSVYTADGVAERKRLEEEFGQWVVKRQAQITEELKPEWQKMVEAYGDTTRAMKDFNERFVTGGLRAGENAFVNWARTGKLSVKDLFGTLRDEIARTVYQQQIAAPLSQGLTGLAGFIGRSLFGGGGHAQNLGAVSGAFPQEHSGGIVGGPAVMRRVPLSVFNNARRMHSGGLASNEVPTILEKGEEVLTRADPRHRKNGGATPAVTVNMINQSGQPMEAQASAPRFDGEGYVIDVVMKRLSRDAGFRDGVRSMLAAPV